MLKTILIVLMIWFPAECKRDNIPFVIQNGGASNNISDLPPTQANTVAYSVTNEFPAANYTELLNKNSSIIASFDLINGSLETSDREQKWIESLFHEHQWNRTLSNEIGRTIRKAKEELEVFSSIRAPTVSFPLLKTCRTRDGRRLPPDVFAWDTCAHCYLFELGKNYHHEAPWAVKMKSHRMGFTVADFLVLINMTNEQHEVEANVSDDDLFLSVPHEKFQSQWKECCLAAIRCCETMLLDEYKFQNMTSYCPRTWDGWQCWKDTLPDSEVYEPCPLYSYIESTPSCTKMARKRCEESGKWFEREDGKEWTDYSTCGILPNIKLRIFLHIFALSLSILALIPALFIFCWFRQLRVHRITLHKHLFASLLLEAVFSFVFRFLEIFGGSLLKRNPTWCIAIRILRIYSRQTNYTWYLCEGFYLHQLLVSAFAKPISLAMFYSIGWGFPAIPVLLYTLFRGIWYENAHCWNMPIEGIEWLVLVPPLLALMVNLFFIINVMRILLSKVRAKHDLEPYHFRMAVRATLMVVPLFGLQYTITIYRPRGQACSWHDFYHSVNNIIDGSTGLIVAIIFCFANSEVRNLLCRSWHRIKDKHETPTLRELYGSLLRSRSMSTVQTTLVETHSVPRRASSYMSMNTVTSNIINNKSMKSLPISEVFPKSRSSYPSTSSKDLNLETFFSVPANLALPDSKFPDYTNNAVESNPLESQNIYYIDEDVDDNVSECSKNWTLPFGDDYT